MLEGIMDLQEEEIGCIVYQVVNSSIVVRSHPTVLSEDITRLEFDVNELVSVDLIISNDQNGGGDDNNNSNKHGGPFVRLSDRTGWLFVKDLRGVERLRRLNVERGLWAFYIDNCCCNHVVVVNDDADGGVGGVGAVGGQTVRRHPVESQDLHVEYNGRAVHLLPMQKVYCDARVLHPATGVNFYRIQGTTGWIFDRTSSSSSSSNVASSSLAPEEIMFEKNGGGKAVLPHSPSGSAMTVVGGSSSSSSDALLDRCMLIPEHKVKCGLFCFRALYTMVIRSIPSTSEDCMTRHIIKAGEMVAVDIIRDSPTLVEEDGDDDGGDGPFLRLTDGSGWLFEYKHDVKVMEQVGTMRHGAWEVQVLNPPVGVGLRRHPVDSQTIMFQTIYPTDTLLQCDCKVVGHDGVAFYRVCNTIGWIFDQRGDSDLLKELSAAEDNDGTTTSIDNGDDKKGWTPDFVRGIAATVDHLEENAAWEGSTVLTFRLLPDSHVVEIDNEQDDTSFTNSNPAQDETTTTLLQALSDTNGTDARITTINTEKKTTTIATLSPAVALCFHIYYESRTVGIYDETVQRQVCERDCSTKDLVRLFNSSVAELVDMLRKASPEPSFTESVLKAAAAGPPVPVLRRTKKKKQIIQKPNHQRRFEMGSFGSHSFETPSPTDENSNNFDFGEEKKQDYDQDFERIGEIGNGELESKEATTKTPRDFTNDLQEVELRTQLVRCEEALLNVRQQQVDILKSLKVFDDKRARLALQAKAIADERRMEDEIEQEAKRVVTSSSHHVSDHHKNKTTSVAVRLSGGGVGGGGGVEATRNSSGSASSRKLYRCGECREGFSGSAVRDEHCRDVHGIYCEHCNRAFKSFQRLEQHREHADHW